MIIMIDNDIMLIRVIIEVLVWIVGIESERLWRDGWKIEREDRGIERENGGIWKEGGGVWREDNGV